MEELIRQAIGGWIEANNTSQLEFLGLRDGRVARLRAGTRGECELMLNDLNVVAISSSADGLGDWVAILASDIAGQGAAPMIVLDFLSLASSLFDTLYGRPSTPSAAPASQASPADETPQSVEAALRAWTAAHPDQALRLLAVAGEPDFRADLVLGEPPVPLSVFFNREWRPLFASSEDAALTGLLEPFNVQLARGPPPLSRALSFLDAHLAPPPPAAPAGNGAAWGRAPASLMASLSERLRSGGLARPHIGHGSDEAEPMDAEASDDAPDADDDGLMDWEEMSVAQAPAPGAPAPDEPNLLDWEDTIVPGVVAALETRGVEPMRLRDLITRLRALVISSPEEAIPFVLRDLCGPSELPVAARRFFRADARGPRRLAVAQPSRAGSGQLLPAAMARLRDEHAHFKTEAWKENSPVVGSPAFGDMSHWHVSLMDVTPGLHSVRLEIKFPPDFPAAPPAVRFIHPRLVTDRPLRLPDHTLTSSGGGADAGVSELRASSQAEVAVCSAYSPDRRVFAWLVDVRAQLAAAGARADVAQNDVPLPTEGGFWRFYRAESAAALGREDVECGGKVLLPADAVTEIISLTDTPERAPVLRFFPALQQDDGVEVPTAVPRDNAAAILELTVGETHRRSFVGVLEFTAPRGVCVVPSWLLQQLHGVPGATVQLRRVCLPKGCKVTLRPHDASFFDGSPKQSLEWVLSRHFVALATGDTLMLHLHDKRMPVDVIDTMPGKAISIVDTDLDLDFAPPLVGELPAPLAFTADVQMPDISQSSSKPSASAATSGGGGNSSSSSASNGQGDRAGRLDTSTLAAGVDYVPCENCRQPVARAQMQLHAARCARLNWFCAECAQVIPKAERDAHVAAVHAPEPCALCGEVLERRALREHAARLCPQRSVQCGFCQLRMTAARLDAHEVECGNRTERCPTCSQFVLRRAFAMHEATCGRSDAEVDQSFAMRRSFSALVCDHCQASCENFEELQVHVLTAHPDKI